MKVMKVPSNQSRKSSARDNITNGDAVVIDLDKADVPRKKARVEKSIDAAAQMPKDLALTDQFDSKVRPFIDLVDDLRQYGLEQDINLPAIVVIGDQSSGKSSILEAISGVQLPRGSGIVTRCPLEMKLKRSVKDTQLKWSSRLQYTTAEGIKKDIDVESPSNIENLIRFAQNEIAGNKSGISENLISLSVTSSECPDLTLIDLPGIARTAVAGQPSNICEKIKDLLRGFIENPQTIILCVIPANVDIAVNEALSLANNYDENGIRTLGVLTKPDLVDRGTENDVLAILSNEKYHLKKGYSIVRCRGQQEITDGSTLNDAMIEESKFFAKHRHYQSVPDYQKGIQQLAIKLTDNLVEHIQRILPNLYHDVEEKLKKASEILTQLGCGIPDQDSGKRYYLMKVITNVIETMEKLIIKGDVVPVSVIKSSKGHELPELKNISQNATVNAAWGWRHRFDRLRKRIDYQTSNEISRGAFKVSNLTNSLDIYRGRELEPFLNFELFESLVREHIKKYKPVLTECLEDVNKDTYALVLHACKEHLQFLPKVLDKVKFLAEETRVESLDRGYELMELEIQKEQLVYVQDQTFSTEITKRMQTTRTTNKKTVDPSEVQEIVQDYMTVANRRISDSVPMLIRATQHHQYFKLLKDRLQCMVGEDGIEEIVKEDYKLESKRKSMEARRQRLTSAMRRLAQSQEIGIDISSLRYDGLIPKVHI